MTSEELEAIEAIANAATPGPWRAVPSESIVSGWHVCVGEELDDLAEADSEFCAAARTAVPELIVALCDLAARHARVHDEADRYQTRALEAEADVLRFQAENDQAHACLARVFLHHAPKSEPLADLIGICTQIDNLTMFIPQMSARIAELEARPRYSTEAVDSAFDRLRTERESGGPSTLRDYAIFVDAVRASREPKL